ncbi:DUF2986 domain-containing protein [Marinomonas mediterranea]|jgi:Protein of unknown function (DUF2986).|uniref:DUF2986 domain-containing protein n=1 Tax=Marinomonas mediterranea (strain ATCC 700492 / JCM 21426 / NBRC 103028 / MMB-1) TaxID=717774 RepID=F2K0J5_MARM1|nr:DUF2986 domain-containing protein [Marinomonas mediterranea]ADZ90979.1 hypothetical protein Marme_1723 [Marinomonas mediterranea MMB-1]WCN09019.1 DUF2986 domain-containing protein [Marinomonas mediterranea]WCN13053.1 DUF2986 domain-containing protein [Marinomonas mediterranea]WCN17122.1 DUF2986 domain-containing protein [Marinomonas mediterranea MMB-1]
MNRRKKIKGILTKKAKRANLKANPKKAKPKYISKADRAALDDQATETTTIDTSSTETIES